MKNDDFNSPDCKWTTPDSHPVLGSNAVHVWCASLVQESEIINRLPALLPDDELSKAKSFQYERDQHKYIVSHAFLRLILGRYLNVKPFLIPILRNEYGKPYIPDDYNYFHLQFNISHSHNLALFAFSSGDRIGVDIELIRPISEMKIIAERHFSPREKKTYDNLPINERLEGFFNCWTRKEAFVKAVGKGLSFSLASFDVSLTPKRPAKLLTVRNSFGKQKWFLGDLSPASGYKAAIAVEKNDLDLKCFQFTY